MRDTEKIYTIRDRINMYNSNKRTEILASTNNETTKCYTRIHSIKNNKNEPYLKPNFVRNLIAKIENKEVIQIGTNEPENPQVIRQFSQKPKEVEAPADIVRTRIQQFSKYTDDPETQNENNLKTKVTRNQSLDFTHLRQQFEVTEIPSETMESSSKKFKTSNQFEVPTESAFDFVWNDLNANQKEVDKSVINGNQNEYNEWKFNGNQKEYDELEVTGNQEEYEECELNGNQEEYNELERLDVEEDNELESLEDDVNQKIHVRKNANIEKYFEEIYNKDVHDNELVISEEFNDLISYNAKEETEDNYLVENESIDFELEDIIDGILNENNHNSTQTNMFTCHEDENKNLPINGLRNLSLDDSIGKIYKNNEVMFLELGKKSENLSDTKSINYRKEKLEIEDVTSYNSIIVQYSTALENNTIGSITVEFLDDLEPYATKELSDKANNRELDILNEEIVNNSLSEQTIDALDIEKGTIDTLTTEFDKLKLLNENAEIKIWNENISRNNRLSKYESDDVEIPKRKHSVADIIEVFNTYKSDGLKSKPQNDYFNMSRPRTSSSGNIGLSACDNRNIFYARRSSVGDIKDVNRGNTAESIKKRMPLKNTIKKRIDIYENLNVLRNKLIRNESIECAPSISEEYEEYQNGLDMEYIDTNESMDNDFLDYGDFNQEDIRRREELVLFYNKLFESISTPALYIMAVYCLFSFILDILCSIF